MPRIPAERNLKGHMITFPLWGIDPETLTCRCPDGASCTHPGKHPKQKGYMDLTESVPAEPGDNTGILIPYRYIVIDLDIKPDKGIDGEAVWAELCASHGGEVRTIATRTGSGGRHLFYILPPDEHDDIVSSANALGPGVDVWSCFRYVVAPGSLHVSGRKYEFIDPELGIREAPAWLLAMPEMRGKKSKKPAKPKTSLSERTLARNLAAAKKHVDKCPPPTGPTTQTDSNRIFALCGYLIDKWALTDEQVHELVLPWIAKGDSKSDRSGPPEDPRSLWRKIDEARNKGANNVPTVDSVEEIEELGSLFQTRTVCTDKPHVYELDQSIYTGATGEKLTQIRSKNMSMKDQVAAVDATPKASVDSFLKPHIPAGMGINRPVVPSSPLPSPVVPVRTTPSPVVPSL